VTVAQLLDELHGMDACTEARAWVEENGIASIEEAWTKCPRGEWLAWLLASIHEEWAQIARTFIERAYFPHLDDNSRATAETKLEAVYVGDDQDLYHHPFLPAAFNRTLRAIYAYRRSVHEGSRDHADSLVRWLWHERRMAGEPLSDGGSAAVLFRSLVSTEEVVARWNRYPHVSHPSEEDAP